MNTANNKKPGSLGLPRQVTAQSRNTSQRKPSLVQLTSGVSAQSVKRPVAPPIYKPQPPQRFVQRKLAAAPAIIAQGVRSAIQLSKGEQGGKGGGGYSTQSKDSEELNAKAMEKAKLPKGIKGHGMGDSSSNWSGQTKVESERFHEARRELRAEGKEIAKGCRAFHKKIHLDEKCPSCKKIVTEDML